MNNKVAPTQQYEQPLAPALGRHRSMVGINAKAYLQQKKKLLVTF
jgi:hypothetical protein